MFKQSVYCDQLEIPDGMADSTNLFPPEFFVNLRWSSALPTFKVKAAEVDLGEAAKDPNEDVVTEE